MFNFRKSVVRISVTSLMFASAAGFLLDAGASHEVDAIAIGKPNAEPIRSASPATQRNKDLEHEMQEDVNHPREIVGAPRKPMATRKASPATQKDKDLEHEMVQSDGVNHPRETVGAPKKPIAMKKALPATQRDKDLEHEMVQSDGVVHPREVLNK